MKTANEISKTVCKELGILNTPEKMLFDINQAIQLLRINIKFQPRKVNSFTDYVCVPEHAIALIETWVAYKTSIHLKKTKEASKYLALWHTLLRAVKQIKKIKENNNGNE